MENDIIQQLRKERVKKDLVIEDLIRKLYDELMKSIRFKNKNNITQMTYTVPHIFLGFPLYDPGDVTFKLSVFLKKRGFKTTINNTELYISW